VRIAAKPLEAYVEGYVIEQWRNPQARKIAQSDSERMERIAEISDEMSKLQDQKNEALRMKLRKEVDLRTFREVVREIDAAHDQLAREHKHLTSEAALPELPDPSLAWEDLSAVDGRARTEGAGGQDHHRAAPEQDRQGRQAPLHHPPSRTKILSKRLSGSRRCMRLGSRSSPGCERTINRFPTKKFWAPDPS
jgi:hypothetical protein